MPQAQIGFTMLVKVEIIEREVKKYTYELEVTEAQLADDCVMGELALEKHYAGDDSFTMETLISVEILDQKVVGAN